MTVVQSEITGNPVTIFEKRPYPIQTDAGKSSYSTILGGIGIKGNVFGKRYFYREGIDEDQARALHRSMRERYRYSGNIEHALQAAEGNEIGTSTGLTENPQHPTYLHGDGDVLKRIEIVAKQERTIVVD